MSESGTQHFFADALARARTARAAGDLAAALRELQVGLQGVADYPTAVTTARFLENTAKDSPPALWPRRKMALVGADTLTFLRPVLRALAFRDGWWPIFYEAPFGVWRQEILEPQSELRKFQPEITLVLRGWRSLGEAATTAEQLFQEELALATQAANGLGLVLWPGYDFPEQVSAKHTALSMVLAEVNQRLQTALPRELFWVDVAKLQRHVSVVREDERLWNATRLQVSCQPRPHEWEDERLWEAVRQHPSPVASVALVELWLAMLRARWGQARKVLVTDLDNVLWGGVVGEDGVDGLGIGPDSAESDARWDYQQYLLRLKELGVLLAVCSKNNEADVQEVFARRRMPLAREDFSGWMVNWNDKAENLRALAAKLKLGLDSFVFVDDQDAERARVRQALPEVAVPELPASPLDYVACLQSRRFFDTITLSAEDRGRAAAYRANEQRDELRTGANSVEDFLRSLDMVGAHGPFSEAELERVEQLLTRTNQWNLTTRRHSRAEITAELSRPGTLTQWFRLRDRFGDNGLVGLWVALPRGDGEWEIDSWVMSCRVIGRGLEDLMFNTLLESVRAVGGRRLRGVYLPTAENALVAGLLPKFGFVPNGSSTENAGQAFTLAIEQASQRPHFIRVDGSAR